MMDLLPSCNTIETNLVSVADAALLEPDHVEQAISMLIEHWGGTVDARRRMLTTTRDSNGSCCSYLLVCSCTNVVIGHAKLATSGICMGDSSHDCACGVVTSVITTKSHRGLGFGAILMRLLEQQAREVGYIFLYLWTNDAAGFYQKLGYRTTERATEGLSAFKNIGKKSLSLLEGMLSSKVAQQAQAQNGGGANSEGDAVGAHTTWLRKLLRDELPLEWLDTTLCWEPAVRSAWAEFQQTQIQSSGISSRSISSCSSIQLVEGEAQSPLTLISVNNDAECPSVFLRPVPYAPQVGPSCGIQAIRMAHASLRRGNEQQLEPQLEQQPKESRSLLQRAIDAGQFYLFLPLTLFPYLFLSVPLSCSFSLFLLLSSSFFSTFLPLSPSLSFLINHVTINKSINPAGYSAEGELFDVESVAALCRSVGLQASVEPFAALGWAGEVLLWLLLLLLIAENRTPVVFDH
jgi:GNAT superfamily N-acetyltransferase